MGGLSWGYVEENVQGWTHLKKTLLYDPDLILTCSQDVASAPARINGTLNGCDLSLLSSGLQDS